MAGIFAVAKAAAGGDGQDGEGAVGEASAVRAEELHHFRHARHAVGGEGAGDDWLMGVGEAEIEAPGVGDFFGNIVGGKGGGQIGDVRQDVGQASVVDKIGRIGWARLAAAMVQNVQAAGTGGEVHVIPTDLRMGPAFPIRARVKLLGASAMAWSTMCAGKWIR